uniref:Uncharacterized protein n=1 Tax=Branchiostoma floridae TaxID=7739 RepID=C3XPD6_BRAFL|eukprot:XP_002613798.1 hypothetical protein BRAFLDRAFT_85339 [Branchiostoma floridae]
MKRLQRGSRLNVQSASKKITFTLITDNQINRTQSKLIVIPYLDFRPLITVCPPLEDHSASRDNRYRTETTWRMFEIRLPERQKAMGNENSIEVVTDKDVEDTAVVAAVDMEGLRKETAAQGGPKTFSDPADDDNSLLECKEHLMASSSENIFTERRK